MYYQTFINKNCSIFCQLPPLYCNFFGNLCIKGALYKGLQLLMLLYSQREQFINLLNMENICQNIPVGYVDGSPEI